MRAQDIMTQYVISVSPEDTIETAVQRMIDERISGLPVIDSSGRLVGMVTEGDFLRRAETETERRLSRNRARRLASRRRTGKHDIQCANYFRI